jgi:hypothetical protein
VSASAKLVPKWVRIVVGLVALFNLAYGLLGYINPETILPGLDTNIESVQNIIQTYSALNMAIAIALSIVAIVGVPESMAIVMIIRFLVEVQDLVLSIFNGEPFSSLLITVMFIIIELVIIVTLVNIVNAQHKVSETH